MENLKNHAPITPGSVLLEVKEMLRESSVKFDRELRLSRAESRAESKRRFAEFEQERKKREEEAEQERKKRIEEDELERKKRIEEDELERKKRDESFEKFHKEWLKSLEPIKEMIGGMGNSNGEYAEEFFYNALLKGKKNILGESFDEVVKRNRVTVKKGFEDEYDILLINGRSVCIVEVKYKADGSQLPQKVLRKAQTFRVNFPQFSDKSIYLAVAGMSFHPLTEKACKENGIAIIKQVGDTMVIRDDHLKVF